VTRDDFYELADAARLRAARAATPAERKRHLDIADAWDWVAGGSKVVPPLPSAGHSP
jgi:hypothetical protein